MSEFAAAMVMYVMGGLLGSAITVAIVTTINLNTERKDKDGNR